LVASLLHFYSGQPLQNLSDVDTGAQNREIVELLASRVELDRYGSHKKLCCRADYVVSARTIIMFVKV